MSIFQFRYFGANQLSEFMAHMDSNTVSCRFGWKQVCNVMQDYKKKVQGIMGQQSATFFVKFQFLTFDPETDL